MSLGVWDTSYCESLKILTQNRSDVQQKYAAENFASFKNLNLDPSAITAEVAQEVLVVCGCEAFANSCLSPVGKQFLHPTWTPHLAR